MISAIIVELRAVMLSTLNELSYDVGWHVINAAEYRNAQTLRRVFIFAYGRSMAYGKAMNEVTPKSLIYKEGMFARAFPIQ